MESDVLQYAAGTYQISPMGAYCASAPVSTAEIGSVTYNAPGGNTVKIINGR